MEEKKHEKKQGGLFLVWIVCFGVIAGAIALLCYSIFNQTETRTSTVKEEGEMGVLECKSSQLKEPFLTGDGELSGVHKVKIMLKNEKPSEVSYEYTGTYGTEEAAKAASGKMRADYDIALRGEAKKLSPIFGATGTNVRVSLYAAGGKLNSVNAQAFYLTTDEMLEFYKLSRSSIEKIYKGKGFSCTYNK